MLRASLLIARRRFQTPAACLLRLTLAASGVVTCLSAGAASAQTVYPVTRFDDTSFATLQTGGGFGPGVSGDLRYELYAAIAAGGPSLITFPGCTVAAPCTIVLGAPLPPIYEATANTGATAPASFSLTVDGGAEGSVILDGNSRGANTTSGASTSNRVFFVDNVAVTLRNLVIQNALATGGTGGHGQSSGGGGAGFGAGLFVNQATASVLVQNTVFNQCAVAGGAGGEAPGAYGGFTGGGGLAFAGGSGASSTGGGGGGVSGAGGSGTDPTHPFNSGYGGNGGAGGGGGGGGDVIPGGGGSAYGANSSGSGAASTQGGNAGFGSGGGGGRASAGNGGFGGGGGSSHDGAGGNGGFGGGGGGSLTSTFGTSAAAVGGVQGGNGGSTFGAGGGGAAAGAAIFVANGSVMLSNTTGSGFSATPGGGGGFGATAGAADATGVFNYGGAVNGSPSVGAVYNAFTVTEPVGTASATQTATLTFTAAVNAGSAVTVNVLTQGAAGLDFAFVSGGTCTSGAAYAAGAECTVQYSFTPQYPGTRYGGITLTNASGLLASTLITGVGVGPLATFSPGVISTVAGNGTACSTSTAACGDTGAATSANLQNSFGVTVDGAGNLYIADFSNNRIRKVTAATGIITTVAGNGTQGFSGDGGAAASAELNLPSGVAVDGVGNLYIADQKNNRIRKVTAPTGIITTVAGNGTRGYSGEGIAATSAALNQPSGVTVDGAGNLYIGGNSSQRVHRVTTATGIMTTVAGNGTLGSSGDGGIATGAELNDPEGVAVDGAGNLYIGDSYNYRIRKVAAATGIITTVAGGGTQSVHQGGVAATNSELGLPYGVSVDDAGNIYFADSGYNVIRKVTVATGIISTVAGNGTAAFTGDGSAANSAEISNPLGVVVDSAGNVYFTDYNNQRIRKVTATAAPLAFPATTDGSTSASQTVTLNNLGNTALTLEIPGSGQNPSLSANFTQSNSSTCPLAYSSSMSAGTLAAGSNCTEVLSFAPGTGVSGSVPGSLTFTDNHLNASSATQTVGLSGTATLSVSQLAFHTAPPSVTSAGRAGTVTVNEEDASANTVIAAKDTITLTVTSPDSSSLTYTAAAVSGVATFNLSSVTLTQAGSYTYVASLLGATSASTTETVLSNTVTTIGSSQDPAPINTPITFTATVSARPPGTGTPTDGYVVFGAPGQTQQSVPISNGSAQATFTFTTAGQATVYAIFDEARYYNSSNGTITQVSQQPYSYLVTTLADDATGVAANCVTGATDTGGGNASCSLRDAIAASNAVGAAGTSTGMTISFLSSLASAASPGTVNITTGGTLAISQPVTINGPGANVLTVEGGTTPNSTSNVQILQITGGTVAISGLTLANGYTNNGGGAIYVSGNGALTVSNSTFSGNQANSSGGAIDMSNLGALTVNGSTFSGNSASSGGSGNGGAIFARGTLTVSNSTFSGNSASSVGGGGGAISAFTAVLVNNSTFSGNSAQYGGGIFAASGSVSAPTVSNSLFTGDSASASGSAIYSANGGTATNIVYNGETFTNVTPANSINADPKLASLANYGGPTPTLLPLPGSAAICAGTQPTLNGTPLASDQRGGTISPNRYGQSTCYDIGAVQTGYAFTLGPNLVVPSLVTLGSPINPAPVATVTESGTPLIAGAATVNITDAQSDLSGSATISVNTSASNGQASFANLLFTAAEVSDTLTATLPLNPNLTPALSIAATSNSFQVSQLTPVITWLNPAAITYGTPLSSTQLNATATYNQQTVQGQLNYNPPANTILAVGLQTLSATFNPTDSTLYASAGGSVQLQVNQATPVVSVAAASVNYGTASTILTASVTYPAGTLAPSGSLTFVIDSGSPIAASCTGTSSPLTCTATYSTGTLAAASHVISATIASDSNYAVASGTNTLTVSAIAPTISFALSNHTYGDASLTLSATTNSSAPITYSYVSGPATVNGSTVTITGAGSVTIQASEVAAGNYTAGSQNTTFTVAQKPLTATIIGNPTKVYDGTTAATLTSANYQLSGLAGTDAVTVAQPSGIYAAATAGSEPVSASLTSSNFSASAGSLSNYILPTGASGSGTITKATTSNTIAWATPAAITYGAPLSSTQLSAIANVPGGYSYTPPATTVLSAGSQTLTVNFTPTDTTDYQPGSASVVLQVNKATSIVTATVASVSYGASSATLSATITYAAGALAPSGALTFAVDNGAPVVGTCTGTTSPRTCTASYPTSTLSAGPHTITASIAMDSNYLAASGTNTLTVNAIAPAISFALSNHTYGDAPVTLSSTSNSNAPITYSYVSGPATVNGSAVTITGAGSVTIQASQAAAGNYTAGSQNATFTVAARPITVNIIGNPTKVYNNTTVATLTSANYQLTGLVGTDAITVTQLAGTYAAATAGSETVTSSLTTSNFSASTGSLSNYVLPTSASGPGTITKAPTNSAITWANPNSFNYGTLLSSTQLNAGSAVGGNFSYNPTAGVLLSAGPQTLNVTFTPTDTTDYATGTASVPLTVNRATPGIVVSSGAINYATASTTLTASVTYPAGAIAPSSTFTFVIDSGNPVVASCAASVSPRVCTATYSTSTINAGPHTITASLAMDSNYLAASGSNTLTVSAVAPVINFTAPAPTYGDAPITLVASSSSSASIVYSYVGGPVTLNGSTLTIKGAGSVTIQASQVAAGNYTAGSQNVTFTVAQKLLTATIIGNPTKVYDGTTSIALTSANYQVGGLVSPDSILVTQSTGAYAAATAGTETVSAALTASNFTASVGSLSNYILPNTASGPGTIAKATPSITWAVPAAITYGTPLSTTQLNATSSVKANPVYNPTSGSILGAGSQTLTATFTPQDAADYNTVTATVKMTVNPAIPTLTFTVPNHIYGDAPFTVSATSPSTGAITYSVVTGPATISGSTVALTGEGTVILQASQAASTNYVAGSAKATFTVATPVVLNLASTTLLYPLPPAFDVRIGLNNKIPPTGTVTVLDGTIVVGTYPVLAILNGNALGLVLPPLKVGQHTLSAVYSGDRNFTPGASAPVTVTVTAGPVI